MAEVVNIGANAYDVRKSVAQLPYSKVIINVEKIGDNEVISYISGDDTGETLELDCPWGTQEMADNLLESIRGYQYQPYTVTSAIINPAVELGDAINTNGVYGGNYQQDSTFTHTFYSDFSAPQDEQLDHEFTYESPTERKLSRQQAWAKATFQIQHDNIEARVTKKSGDIEENSFSWRLLSDEFGLYAGTKKVFRCYKDGIMVDGEIRARTGYIGSDSQGFVINDKNIHNGMDAYNDSQHNGVYLGTDGIGLGAGKFTVTSSGVLNATSATVSGTITAKSGKIGADSNGNGGFDITTNAIKNGKTSYSETDNDGVYIGTSGIGLGKGVFYVDNKGNVTANNITVKGKLGGTSGFTVTDGKFYSGNKTAYNDSNTGVYVGTDGIGLGSSKFYVTSSGDITAKSATITGVINAKTGRIGATEDASGNLSGGFEITTNAIRNGKTSYSETDNDGVYIGTSGIGLGKGIFYVDNKGNVTANNITVKGKLGGSSGFTVADGKFYSGSKSSYDSNTSGVYVGTDGIGLGSAKFYVTSSGSLTSKDATITGTITAKSGRIGADSDGNNGFEITTNAIKNGKTSYSETTNDGVYIGTSGIGLGKGMFYVDSQGNVTANNITIKGKLGGSSGFVVDSGKFYSNSKTSYDSNTSGVYVGTDGIGLGAGKFYVTSGGALTAKDIDISGKVTATSGKIGSDTSAWVIGTKSIYNGTDSISSTTQGAYVGIDGIRIYNDSQNNFTFQKNGTLEIMKGMTSYSDVGNTSGYYIGGDGIALGGGKLTLNKDGTLTAKKGVIGSDSSAWNIGAKSIYNGTDSISSTTQGAYIGIDGIRIYNSDTQSFTFKKDGTIDIRKGMNGFSDTTNTSGYYIGADGIALGGGNLLLNKDGSLTAKKGEIAGWDINTNSLSKIVRSGSSVTSHIGMSSTSSVAFFAGQSASSSDCAFKVTNNGKVYLTQLYTRVVDTNPDDYPPEQPYDEDDPSTWIWIDSEIDLGQNGFKIGDDYKTIRSIGSDGTVRLSNGSSFKTAASVYCKGSWSGEISSGQTLTVKPKVTTKSGEKDAGGASYSMTLSGQWIKEPYYYGDNKTIYAVQDDGGSVHLEAPKISATCEYDSSLKNYVVVVKSGTEQIYSGSAGFSKMSITRVQTEVTTQGQSKYYGKLYYWNARTSSYVAASDSDHYWYYSDTDKSGTNTLYYK